MKKKFRKISEKKYYQNSNNLTQKVSVHSNNIYSTYFFNTAFDKSKLKTFVSWFLKKYGQKKTIELLEDLKNLGFEYATLGGISLGIDDLKIPPTKADLLFRADWEIKSSNFRSTRAELTGVEQFQTLIDTWHQTSETLKQDVIKYFELTDVFNPVYMMAFSGARGNVSQVRQLVGMRGLMADPQGQIIDFPIRSNFREGLTLTEYIISTYGARKGIVDTALRTATAGYLTRRLVDVAQHVIVSQFDCGTQRGIFLFDMKEGLKTIYSFKDRLIGRVLAQDIYENNTNKTKKIGFRNQEISNDLAVSIAKVTKKALVRSPLTCETRRLVCQLCYGWSLSKGSLVSLGEAVGVIAAQSIGEPGTQLTMRTFHTGGVFSGGITDQIIAPESGTIYYSTPIPGSCIRTPQGGIAFLTKIDGSFLFKSDIGHECTAVVEQFYKIPAYTILFVRHEQKVYKKQILAQFSALSKQQAVQADAEQVIYSKFEGQVYFSQLDLMEQSHEKYGDITWKTDDWAKIWILSGKVYENPVLSYFFPNPGDFITKQSLMNQIQWYTPQSAVIDFNSSKIKANRFKESIFSSLRTSKFLTGNTTSLKTFQSSTPNTLNCFKIKAQKLNVLNFSSNSNVHILSKKIISSSLSLKANFFSQSTEPTVQNSSFLKKRFYELDFSNSQTITDLKLVNIQTPFYYPFQKVSFKRLISFLSYQTQKETIIKKTNLKFNTLMGETKSKKALSKNRVSILDLQKKWQPWLRTSQLPKKIYKKTIQSQLKSPSFNYFVNNPLFKRTTNRMHIMNFTNFLNEKFINKSNLFKPKQYLSEVKSKKHLNLFSVTFKRLKFPNNRMLTSDNLLKNIAKNKTQLKFINLEKRQKIMAGLKMENPSQLTKIFAERNSNFLLKSPLLQFSLNTLNYKKISYTLVINRTKNSNNLNLNSNEDKQSSSDFDLTNKITLLTYFPINERFLTNNTKLKESNIKSMFSTNLRLNNKMIEQRHLNLKNTFSWSNFPTKFFSWFPDDYQTRNNGVFFMSGPTNFGSYPNQSVPFFIFLQKNKKLLKNCHKKKIYPLHKFLLSNIPGLKHFNQSDTDTKNLIISKVTLKPIKQSSNLKNSKNQNYQSFKFQDYSGLSFPRQNNSFYQFSNLRKWNKNEIFFSDSKKLKAKNINLLKFNESLTICSNISKSLTIELFKIKSKNSTIRWNNTKFIENYKLFNIETPNSSKIFKHKVSFNELFWLPEEKYEIITQSSQKQKNNRTELLTSKFLKSEQPICLVSNRQGLKKLVLSKLEGFISIRSKHHELNNLKRPLKNEEYFIPTNLKLANRDLVDLKNFKVSKSDLKQQMNQKLGSTALKTLKVILKNHLNYAILKDRQKKINRSNIQKIFKNKIKSKKLINSSNSLACFNKLENNNNYLGVCPIKKINISKVKEDRITMKNVTKLININNSTFTISTKEITLKEGWIYMINDFSIINYLHQSIIEPGISFLNNISFSHSRIFIEILPISFDFNLKKQKQFNSCPSFNIKKTVLNENSRFFKTSMNSHKLTVLILIRPMYYRIVRNSEKFKRDLFKFNKKTKFSLIDLNRFYSSLINQQKSSGKLIASFPAPDFLVDSKMNLPSKGPSLENSLKFRKQSKLVPILSEFPLKLKTEYLTKKMEPMGEKFLNFHVLKNQFAAVNKVHFFGSFFEHSYYSYQPINFNPLSIQGSIPANQYYLFKIPLVKFQASETLNLHFFSSKILNVTDVLKFVQFKDFYINSVKKTSQPNLSNTNIQALLPSLQIILNNKTKKMNFYQLLKIQSLNFDFSTPIFDWSYAEKMNYFYNQRFFDYKDEDKTLISNHSIQKQYFKNGTLSHFIPKIENKCFIYSNNQILTTQPLGKTNFISPIEGEILRKETKNQTFSFSDKKNSKHQLILTKSDMVTINLSQNSHPENLNSFSSDVEFSINEKQKSLTELYKKILKFNKSFYLIDSQFQKLKNLGQFELKNFNVKYQQKLYKISGLKIGKPTSSRNLRLGKFLVSGDPLYLDFTVSKSGQIIHLNRNELTLRTGEYLSVSPNAILHSYNGDFIKKNTPVMTLPFQTLKTGDIVQGIPKVEQYLEARTTQQGRLFLRSLPVLMQAIFERYSLILSHDKAVRQSLLKIQQILVDGVQRVYRSQGISIADKHLEIIVKQMTSKVQIIFGGQTGLFPGELVDLEFVERLNERILIKIYYEPIVLGITRASLEVDSFLSAASFQQTTKILAKAAIYKQKDYLKGLKENLLIGNLIPAGTGYIMIAKP